MENDGHPREQSQWPSWFIHDLESNQVLKVPPPFHFDTLELHPWRGMDLSVNDDKLYSLRYTALLIETELHTV